MNFRDAIKKIPNHKVILAVGPEDFFRDQVKNKVISLNKNYNVVQLDASEEDGGKILSEISSRDLFSTHRIFCIKNFTKIKNLEFFMSWKSEDILILDSKTKGKSKIYRELEKKALTIECITPKPWELEADALGKIKGYLTNAGFSISEDVSEFLYDRIGYDLYKLMREMQKITLYKKEINDSKIISKKDIENTVADGSNSNVFDILDNLLKGDKGKSLDMLDKVYRYEKNPSILLITLWYTHFENLLYLKSLESLGGNNFVKLPPTVINKLYKQSKKIDLNKILNSLKYLSELDIKLRQGSFNLRFYLDNFIINF